MQFNCDARLPSPSTLLVKVGGVLDAGTSIEMEMTLSPHLRNTAVDKVILEVSDLTFVSSSGLRVMMIIIKTLTPRKGNLYMVGASSQIVGLVKMSGMTKWIHLRDSLRDCENA